MCGNAWSCVHPTLRSFLHRAIYFLIESRHHSEVKRSQNNMPSNKRRMAAFVCIPQEKHSLSQIMGIEKSNDSNLWLRSSKIKSFGRSSPFFSAECASEQVCIIGFANSSGKFNSFNSFACALLFDVPLHNFENISMLLPR